MGRGEAVGARGGGWGGGRQPGAGEAVAAGGGGWVRGRRAEGGWGGGAVQRPMRWAQQLHPQPVSAGAARTRRLGQGLPQNKVTGVCAETTNSGNVNTARACTRHRLRQHKLQARVCCRRRRCRHRLQQHHHHHHHQSSGGARATHSLHTRRRPPAAASPRDPTPGTCATRGPAPSHEVMTDRLRWDLTPDHGKGGSSCHAVVR